MSAALALVVRMVGCIEVPISAVYDPGSPALSEVDIFCRDHEGSWCVHAWPVQPPGLRPYFPSNRLQRELIDAVLVAGEVARP